MTANKIPEWLDRFDLTISDENNTGLFNSSDYDVNDIRFLDLLGGRIGTEIKIKGKRYEIIETHIYTDLTEEYIGKEKGYYLQLEIIVSEIA
jgi:hypothetical protein